MMKNRTDIEKDKVTEIQEEFRLYSDKRSAWAENAQEDKEFRLGRQWSSTEVEQLQARGHSPIVVNVIHPSVESAKAILTSNRPSFRVSPREDSDNKMAQVFNAMLQYVYDISDGDTQSRDIIDNYYTAGMGAALAYQDPSADMGKGEVKFRSLDIFDIYVDPNARDRFCDDATSIIISRQYTKKQAVFLESAFKNAINNATGNYDDDRPTTSRQDLSISQIFFPGDITTLNEDEYIRAYEHYKKETQREFRVFEHFSGEEKLLDEETFKAYLKKEALVIGQEIYIGEEEKVSATAEYERIVNDYTRMKEAIDSDLTLKMADINANASNLIDEYSMSLKDERISKATFDLEKEKVMLDVESSQHKVTEEYNAALEEITPPKEPEPISVGELIKGKIIDVVSVDVTRIKMTVVIGDTLLYERILPLEHYPVVFFMNLHTGTPYPTSDVRLGKGLQEYINKIRSLIIAHASTSTNLKVLLPEGSIDREDFEREWAKPTAVLTYDASEGQPIIAMPAPLPNELYHNEEQARRDLERQFGLYELMMGNSQSAPSTYKATISIDEFGQRRVRSKLMDIEGGLRRLGQVLIPLMQQLYTSEKVFRIAGPNNSLNEYAVNRKMYDDPSGEVKIFNNITIGKYDVAVVTGSTLPTNRYAQLEMYTSLYEKGIIDREAVLGKTEVFDKEEILKRISATEQLTAQVDQLKEEIDRINGDMQTKDREIQNLRNKVEVEKFKSDLNKSEQSMRMASTLFQKRLDDALTQVRKEKGNQSTPPSHSTPKKKSLGLQTTGV